MHRFYIDQKIEGKTIVISDPQQLHHMRDVLRLKEGDEVVVFDSAGNEYICSLTQLNARQTLLTVQSSQLARPRQVRLTIACAIPKKGGMDEIIDGLTQLGVGTIIPMRTERVIVRLDAAGSQSRLERWRRIARSAAEQSARNDIPSISPVAELKDVIAAAGDYQLKLIPTLAGEKKQMREVLHTFTDGKILVLIGPEGDFTPEEVALAIKAGFVPVSLGDTTLRVSTAALAVAAFIHMSLE